MLLSPYHDFLAVNNEETLRGLADALTAKSKDGLFAIKSGDIIEVADTLCLAIKHN